MIISIFLLIGCTDEITKNPGFSSPELAIENYINEEHVFGEVNLINTVYDETILFIEWREKVYLLGELLVDDQKYLVKPITSKVSLRNNIIKASMEFTTSLGNDYTFMFSDNGGSNFISIPESKFHVNVVEGHTLKTKPYGPLISVVKSVENFQ